MELTITLITACIRRFGKDNRTFSVDFEEGPAEPKIRVTDSTTKKTIAIAIMVDDETIKFL